MEANNKQSVDELVNIALNNFDTFCVLFGADKQRAKICLLRSQGKSYGQIAVMLRITKDAVRGMHRRNCGRKQP